jgi:hypothetical protein
VIIAIVVLELIGCFALSVFIGASNRGGVVMTAPLAIGFGTAALQLAVHYLPRRRHIRYGLVLAVALMLLAGVTSFGVGVLPYAHQTLFITAVAVLPQLWWEWFYKGTNVLVLGLIGLVAIPFGFAVWSVANMGIVKVNARLVSQGEPYCLLVSDGRIFSGGYRKVPDDWGLTGWHMFSPRGAGGSGDCCQWDFHALLLTQSNQLFNWSYRTQSFERLSEQSRQALGLKNLSCGEGEP